MKKIEILIGSPRKKGNTQFLAQNIADKLAAPDISLNINFLTDLDINPCTDCRGCKKGELKCIVPDEMQLLYTKLEQADVIVFGTPIYWFGPTAQTKIVIDRLRPYYGNGLLKGKKAALILPAGSGAGDCDLTIELFKRVFTALGIQYLGSVTSESYDIGDAKKDKCAISNVSNLAKKIVDSISIS